MQPRDTADPGNWPPRSPYEAILSSPNGRRKLRAREGTRSQSASPLKKSSTMPNLLPKRTALESEVSEDEDGDEDEETLQLKLQAIEAKLKLKKLQGRKTPSQDRYGGNNRDPVRSPSRGESVLSSKRDGQHRDGVLPRSASTARVQVPLSPSKAATPSDAIQRSPSRVLLGIDKGLNGREISLRKPSRALADPFRDSRDVRKASGANVHQTSTSERRNAGGGKSFSAKMSEAREREGKEQKQRERLAKMQAQRSSAFAVDKAEMGALKQAAEQQLPTPGRSSSRSQQTFSREEVLKGVNGSDHEPTNDNRQKSRQGATSLSRTSSRRGAQLESHQSTSVRGRAPQDEPQDTAHAGTDAVTPGSTAYNDASLYESYSSCNLSRRILPHTFLERTVEGKTPVVIPTLLKSIKSPEYMIPDELVESDFVIFALVASKSPPVEHKKAQRSDTKGEILTSGMEAERSLSNDNGKYMVITLTDLKWTLDLFLFGPAFVRFRKLTPGTLIAILNPEIMPPPQRMSDTGRWSLKLSSAEETVLEVGTSKDLGWCKSIKKDGQACGAWVDLRHTEFCEYHRNMGVEKMRSGRMEVQGMSAPFGPGGRNGSGGSGRGGGWNGKSQRGGFGQKSGQAKGGLQFDWGARSHYMLAGPAGGYGHTPASLLDADDFNIRGGSEARQREILAAREKENAMAESLGLKGNGAGAEYLRLRQNTADAARRAETPSSSQRTETWNAKSLGLTSNKSTSILLSPLKRKRLNDTPLDAGTSARKKKTRFITPKGIREAGRDSLNVYDASAKARVSVEEEDELDIV